jgi:tetratricopeptide (TPR) repeat protein
MLNDHDQVLMRISQIDRKYNGPTTWAAMARCYISLSELQQAEECLAMCARENPMDFNSRIRLAEILEASNRKEEALQVLEAGRTFPH